MIKMKLNLFKRQPRKTFTTVIAFIFSSDHTSQPVIEYIRISLTCAHTNTHVHTRTQSFPGSTVVHLPRKYIPVISKRSRVGGILTSSSSAQFNV